MIKPLSGYFIDTTYFIIYPMLAGETDNSIIYWKDPTFMWSLGHLDDIGRTISKLFKRK